MKSIPSLVASSTVGVAASGFVFGRPQHSTSSRPSSNKRKAAEYDRDRPVLSSPLSRPATSSTSTTPLREQTLPFCPMSDRSSSEPRHYNLMDTPSEQQAGRVGRRRSVIRQVDTMPAQDSSRERRDSVSSRGSWIKRLSTINISHQSSPKSSIGADSPSLTFSHGSAAPILQTWSSPAQLPPNKLVKRTTSGRGPSGEGTSRSGSRSQVPTLRRPATSHQRSATLQQQFQKDTLDSVAATPQHHSSPAYFPHRTPPSKLSPLIKHSSWRFYFDSRPFKLSKERPLGRSSDGDNDCFFPASKKVMLPDEISPPTLLKASMIDSSEIVDGLRIFSPNQYYGGLNLDSEEAITTPDLDITQLTPASDGESHKRVRRSLSMHFSSPTAWISRQGSLRSAKRGGPGKTGGKRYTSAPIPSLPGRATASAHGIQSYRRRDITDPAIYQKTMSEASSIDLDSPFCHPHLESRTRNTSSPLPPLSRLSSFHIDSNRAGLSSSSSTAPRRTPTSLLGANNPNSPFTTSNDRIQPKTSPTVVLHQQRTPRVRDVSASDRGSTLIGSDSETRGFGSGEEDEMDFQSDTVYDSYRTGATGSLRTRNTPLELMFDDSPPSSVPRSKSPGFQEITLNASFREPNNRILEEDESMSTPIKAQKWSDVDMFNTPIRQSTEMDDVMRSSPPNFSLANKAFGHLSLEYDEEEEDWTRDEDSEVISNALSPPSTSINLSRISPSLLNALAEVTQNPLSLAKAGSGDETMRNIFDWSEPLVHEKLDNMGNSPRPKTMHGKQVQDGRGGRTVGRRGPSVLHIRSQSVPIVPDVAGHREHTKLAPKFGTWGMGAKGVSEDWDNDFDFDIMDIDDTDNKGNGISSSAMFVPPAIQASQANVVGHVGQIREVCLLVDDLKRLRGLAREKGILHGTSAGLWKEAEGIIALAIPDEDDVTFSPPQSPVLDTPDRKNAENYQNGGYDAEENGWSYSKSSTSTKGLDDNNLHVRRRSVFSPEDDIFGSAALSNLEITNETQPSTLKTVQQGGGKDSSEFARSVMAHIHQQRAPSDPVISDAAREFPNKMPFDTTSLRDLVQRANALSRLLSEIIRKADGNLSPNRSPHVERESSPAFTRVFTDPLASPPKHLPRSQSNNSILSGHIDSSPTRGLGQRMHMMTVA